jgi:hypothetical protein
MELDLEQGEDLIRESKHLKIYLMNFEGASLQNIIRFTLLFQVSSMLLQESRFQILKFKRLVILVICDRCEGCGNKLCLCEEMVMRFNALSSCDGELLYKQKRLSMML